MMMTARNDSTSVPNAPVRRLNKNDKALLNTANWVAKSELRLEDKVSLAHSKAVFLQGLVVFVGDVHFDEGTWVGIQLTGPSIGKGDCDGTFKGKKYFANVGKNNGVLAPLDKVSQRIVRTEDGEIDEELYLRETEEKRMKAMAMVDVLTDARAAAILKESEEKERKYRYYKEETYIKRLKETQLGDAIKFRGLHPVNLDFDSASTTLTYSTPGSTLHASDFEFAQGLEKTQQNFCLSDPTLPDNPITFASQPFLNMTGYNLSEILGRNCRFLQGKDTDKYHVNRVRQSIAEGADCHVCLLNYRKDGTPFYNRLFMTALRDTRGRIKNYLGVQCEVSEEVAMKINGQEMTLFDAGMKRNGTHFAKRSNRANRPPRQVDLSDDFTESTGSSTEDFTQCLADMDMEEALFRATMDDPFAEMTSEERELFNATRMDPCSGYTAYKTKKNQGDNPASEEPTPTTDDMLRFL